MAAKYANLRNVPTQPIVFTFEELRSQTLNKPALSGPYGTAWQKVMGRAWDTEMDRMDQARRARWPGWCPSDGLIYISRERGLEQVRLVGTGTPGAQEDEQAFRADLINAWDIWTVSGSADGHIDALEKTGLTNVSVHRRIEWSLPTPSFNRYVDAFQNVVWAQFDVLVDKPHPWKPVYWGDGHVWGAGDWTWGSTATVSDVEQLKRQLLRFGSGHETATWIVVNTTTGRLWGSWVWGDGGSWGGTGEPVRWLVGEPHWRTRGLV